MTGNTSKILKAYAFFCTAEKNGLKFSLQDICNETGWTYQTANAYRTKKFHSFLKETENGYFCEGVATISQDAFLRIHSQRASLEKDILRPKYGKEIDVLVDKSREAALLAVQTYNNPTLNLRSYSYTVFMIIAYTALFHAYFCRNREDFWYKNEDGTPKKIDGDYHYWELSECLLHFYKEKSTPEKANIKLFINLRNKIEHRNLPSFDLEISGYAQALLLNYERFLISEFGSYFALSPNLSLALQITEFASPQHEALNRNRSTYYPDIKEFIQKFCEDLPDEIVQSERFCFKVYLFPKLGNHKNTSDISMEYVKIDPNDEDELEKYESLITLVKEKQISVTDKDLLRAGMVVEQVRKRTGVDFKIYHHTNAWKLFKIRTSNLTPSNYDERYCRFNIPFNSFPYTENWVKFLCEKVRNPVEFEKIKKFNRGRV